MSQEKLEKKGVEFTGFIDVEWIEETEVDGPHGRKRKMRKKNRGFAKEARIPLGHVAHIVKSHAKTHDSVNKKLFDRCSEILSGK